MKYFAIFTTLLISSQVFAYSQKIETLKILYESKDFQMAQEIINNILDPNTSSEENLPIQQDDNGNENLEEKLFALFFDGLIHIEQNELEKAEESLTKILDFDKDWEQISEVYYWLAQISFLQKKFSQGIEILKLINEEKISQKEVNSIIQNFLSGEVDDIELNRCVCKNPDNNFIVKKWLDRQTQLSFADQYIWLINYFLHKSEYQNYKKYFFNKVKIKKKGKYNVAVLLHLDLEHSPKNSRFYDLYNLFSMVLENFPNKNKFAIHFYDTKNNGDNFNEILELEELKNMDVIINTSKKNLNKVSQFSKDNNILLYDFSSTKSLDSIKDNEFAFFTHASQETYSLGAAKFILEEIKKQPEFKNATVVYIDKDSKVAEIFKNYLSFNHVQVNEIPFTQEDLKNILYQVRVNLNTIKKEKAKKIKKQNMIEEGKKSIEEKQEEEQETEKLEIVKILEDSNYVFIASPDMVLMGNVIGIIEQINTNPKIFCDYSLLNSNLAEEIFNKENIFYLTSNEFGYDDVNFLTFKEQYFDLFKKFPSLEMFFNYNALQKIFNNISQNKIGVLHDEQKINIISF